MAASLTRRRSPVPDGAGRSGERRRGRVQAQEAPMPTRRRALTPRLLAANLVSGPALLLTMGRLARTPSPGPTRRTTLSPKGERAICFGQHSPFSRTPPSVAAATHVLPQAGEGYIFWSTLSFFSYSPLGRCGDPRWPRPAGGEALRLSLTVPEQSRGEGGEPFDPSADGLGTVRLLNGESRTVPPHPHDVSAHAKTGQANERRLPIDDCRLTIGCEKGRQDE